MSIVMPMRNSNRHMMFICTDGYLFILIGISPSYLLHGSNYFGVVLSFQVRRRRQALAPPSGRPRPCGPWGLTALCGQAEVLSCP